MKAPRKDGSGGAPHWRARRSSAPSEPDVTNGRNPAGSSFLSGQIDQQRGHHREQYGRLRENSRRVQGQIEQIAWSGHGLGGD